MDAPSSSAGSFQLAICHLTIVLLVVAFSFLLASTACADVNQSILNKPHPVFGVPMGVVLLVFVAIAALKRK
jgi:TRAP-type C4-dicarboxylate transport system permease small subunit